MCDVHIFTVPKWIYFAPTVVFSRYRQVKWSSDHITFVRVESEVAPFCHSGFRIIRRMVCVAYDSDRQLEIVGSSEMVA